MRGNAPARRPVQLPPPRAHELLRRRNRNDQRAHGRHVVRNVGGLGESVNGRGSGMRRSRWQQVRSAHRALPALRAGEAQRHLSAAHGASRAPRPCPYAVRRFSSQVRIDLLPGLTGPAAKVGRRLARRPVGTDPRRRGGAAPALSREQHSTVQRAHAHHHGRSGSSAGPSGPGRASRSWATSSEPSSKPRRAAAI